MPNEAPAQSPPHSRWLDALPPGITDAIRNAPGSFVLPQFVPCPHKAYPDHNKIHLAFMLPWMVMGGADAFNLSLLEGLDKDRYRVSVITTHAADNTWQQRFEAVTPEVYTLPSLLDIDHFPAFLSCFIQAHDIDLLFVSNSELSYASLPWLRCHFPGIAVVDYVHAPEWRTRNGGFARTAAAYGDVLDATCVCNEHTRGEMLTRLGCPPQSVQTVYIGVDEAHFDPQTVPAGQARSLLGIDQSRPVVLFPCRTAPQKRPFLMMAIARRLAQQGSDAAFVVVGDGPDLPGMQHYAAQHGLENTVYFAGRQADVRPFYRDANLTLICSSFEGLSLTAYESMAMATPVITSDVGGQAELVTDETGAVLPLLVGEVEGPNAGHFIEDEVTLYADTIRRLLGDPLALVQRGTLCRRRIIKQFSLAGMVRTMDGLFTRLTAPAARQARRQQHAPLQGYARLCAENLLVNIEYLKARAVLEAGEQAGLQTQTSLAARAEAAERELARVQAMRSFRLANRYARFVARNPLLRRLRGLPPPTPEDS